MTRTFPTLLRGFPVPGRAAIALLAMFALPPATDAEAATLELRAIVAVDKGGWSPGNCTTEDGAPFEGTIDFDMGPGDPDRRAIAARSRVLLDSRDGNRSVSMETTARMDVTNRSNGTCTIWDFGPSTYLRMEVVLPWPYTELPLMEGEIEVSYGFVGGRSRGDTSGGDSYSVSTARYTPPYREGYTWDNAYGLAVHTTLAPGERLTIEASSRASAWFPEVRSVPLPAPAAALGAALVLLGALRRR